MKRSLPVRLLTIFFSVFIIHCRAQPGTYVQYTTANGLNTNMLYDILQDNDGFIWISSLMGIYRFDGTHFQAFSIDDGLPDNEVIRINKDRYGRIWFQGYNGRIAFYEKGRFMHPGNHAVLSEIRFRNIPLGFYQDRHDTIHIHGQNGHTIQLYAPSGGLYRFSESPQPTLAFWEHGSDRYRHMFHHIYKNGVRTDTGIRTLTGFWPIDSCFYFHSIDGIRRYAGGRNELLLSWPDTLPHSTKFKIKDHDQFFLLSYDGGVLEFSRGRNGRYTCTRSYRGVTNPSTILKDKEGGVWIPSLTNGLFYFPPLRHRSLVQLPNPGWPGKMITELEYIGGGLLLAGFENSSIGVFDQELRLLNQLTFAHKHAFMPALRIFRAPEAGSYIVGCEAGAYHLSGWYDKTKMPQVNRFEVKAVKGIWFDGKNTVIYNDNTKVGEYDTRSRRVRIRVPEAKDGPVRKYSVCRSASGGLIYTDLAGLHLLQPDGRTQEPPSHPFLQKRILHILDAGKGLYILLSDGQGLALCDENIRILQVLSSPELRKALVRKARIIGQELWIAGSAGLAVFEIRDRKLQLKQRIDKSSGLLSEDVQAFCTDSAFLYVYTQYGLQKLEKSLLFRPGRAPRLFIHSMESGEKSWISPAETIQLPPRCSEIRMQCAALDLQNNSAAVFAYRFNDAQSWIETGSPQFTIPVEFEGEKTLQLRCRKGQSPWSAISTLQLRVPVPFFRQTRVQVLLYCLITLSLTVLTLAYASRLRKRQMRENEMKLRIASLEIKALQAMMNPHFIFNALNAIQQFMNEHDAYQGNKYLSMFSRMIRSSLKSSRDPLISLETETDYIRNYLELEKLRFGQRLEYSIQTGPELNPKTVSLPGMLIQPLVENAIKHGITPGDTICRVDVRFSREGDTLVVTVRDNGPGFRPRSETPPDTHHSMGLDMIRERLHILSDLYHKPFRLDITDHPTQDGGSGVTVRLTLPAGLA